MSAGDCVPEKYGSYCGEMVELKYRGRVVTAEDILYIRELIAAHPGASRRRLSERLCEAWRWRQANGALRDMVCRAQAVDLLQQFQAVTAKSAYEELKTHAEEVRIECEIARISLDRHILEHGCEK